MKPSQLVQLAALASYFTDTLDNTLGFSNIDQYAQIGLFTYHYLRAEPDNGTTYAGTALLVHGVSDLAYGWHYQIPLLTSLGYRVIAPNMLGYGQTSLPEDVERYTLSKSRIRSR
jgi:pimeloyl-ACP methyl ester carboxylesterase